jgi:anti-sigma factor RsiW
VFCDEVLERIELVAAAETTPDERMRAHLAACTRCSAALAHAQQIERLLRARIAPRPPAQFTSRIMGRIRRDRWRREQFLDAGFNVVIAVVALTLIASFWFLLSGTGVGAMGRSALDLLNAAAVETARRALPSLPLYLAAAALVITALGVWWWAERGTA